MYMQYMMGGFMWLVMIGAAVIYVLFLIAFWRMAKAHESMAAAMKEIAENLKSKNPQGG